MECRGPDFRQVGLGEKRVNQLATILKQTNKNKTKTKPNNQPHHRPKASSMDKPALWEGLSTCQEHQWFPWVINSQTQMGKIKRRWRSLLPGHGGVGPWEAVLLARASSLASLLCVLSSRIVMTFVCALEWEFRSSTHLKVGKTPLGSCFLHSGHLGHERRDLLHFSVPEN